MDGLAGVGVAGEAHVGWGAGGNGGYGGRQPSLLWPAVNEPGGDGIAGYGSMASGAGGLGGPVGYAFEGREYIISPPNVIHWGTATPTIPANINVYGLIRPMPGPPTAPTGIVATQIRIYDAVPQVGFKQLIVTVTPPVYNGPKINQYIVEGVPTIPGISAPYQVTSKTNTIVIPGLTNGTIYKFRVKVKTRTMDESPWSVYSNNIAPIWKPQPVTAPGASAAPLQALTARITWTNPIDTGGLFLDKWTITTTPGNMVMVINASYDGYMNPIPVTTAYFLGLTRGVRYLFGIQAWNSQGASTTNNNAGTITYDRPSGVIAPPNKPQPVAFRNPGGSISIYWGLPVDNGGTPILSVTVYNKLGGTVGHWQQTVSFTTTSVTFSGFSSGVTYQFGIYASNAQGDGPVVSTNTVTA
jgi:hypothetical protein